MVETIPTKKITLTVICDNCKNAVEITVESLKGEEIELKIFEEVGRILGENGWKMLGEEHHYCSQKCLEVALIPLCPGCADTGE